jgi:uncharacterized SAM-binding protein YcdF (DUF218 family)
MDSQGNLNEESRTRMEVAIKAFQAKEAPNMVTSGWNYLGNYRIPIAEAMRDYAVQHGIPAKAIQCDVNSRDTVGDAVFTKRNVVLSKGWKRLLVITSDYHAGRAKEIFTFIYGIGYDIDVRSAVSPVTKRSPEKEQKSLQGFHSTFEGLEAGDDTAIWERLRQQHPLYNGYTYPKI